VTGFSVCAKLPRPAANSAVAPPAARMVLRVMFVCVIRFDLQGGRSMLGTAIQLE
jgi:hypothetical protein